MSLAPALNREESRGLYADDQLASALAYFRGGRFDKAEAIYKKVLKKEPQNSGALHMLGLIAQKNGRAERAVQLLIKAAKLDARRPEILCDLGNAFKALGRHKDAIKAHRMVLTMLPNSPEAHSNLGAAYNAAGKAGKAVICFESALKMRPKDVELKFNLGNGLVASERYEEAEEVLRQVVYEKPDHIRAQINLCAALKEQGRYDSAIRRYQKAIIAVPDSAEAHWNHALTLLATGNYADGWDEYEWRSLLPGFAMEKMDRPLWQGEELDGRTLLVHAEQGLGDTLQFVRYLTLMQNLDGEVIFACPDRLIKLLQPVAQNIKIVPLSKRPTHDIQSPLISLPRLFHEALPFEPSERTYLPRDETRVAGWREKLGPPTGRRIGIAWQGSTGYQHDGRRSIPLLNFEQLAKQENLQLVSLQQGDGAEQIAEMPWRDRIVDMTAEMDTDHAFVDTLAVMASLDLVVTSDTAIAHLAGAAGIPVCVALCHLPDWRWGLKGESSPWYDSMRLVRQEQAGDWSGVFRRISAAIAEDA
ncbi:MAG: tetratricopeptide (TPR) repeat protein [Paracoccaceae bacterium]|jgi:tetratricopeptide (TPR) repeat protein